MVWHLCLGTLGLAPLVWHPWFGTLAVDMCLLTTFVMEMPFCKANYGVYGFQVAQSEIRQIVFPSSLLCKVSGMSKALEVFQQKNWEQEM